jgi:hypothetical protein
VRHRTSSTSPTKRTRYTIGAGAAVCAFRVLDDESDGRSATAAWDNWVFGDGIEMYP